ncbi:MAG TPA: BRCT domain-containing protein [Noviherbaspirillum sp.]|uniref:BRCT domain-containing protein n=1 Tax=Noviherbaspirillum sp. TaxID=1926288 RepID=UPI002B4A6296|nr:BRCT domain-containing protein [Noviherbaspirillum sp.]HJV83885.1 BRCT domain-containing protein [Noviherbaspirillum sp.]
MSNFFLRQAAAYANDMKRSLGALVGIAQGLLCDGQLTDEEIRFLDAWLVQNDAIATRWPGDVIHARVREALADGIITESERTHLVETLTQLIGGTLDELAESTHVTSLAFDNVDRIEFPDARFCLTGEFVYAPREKCAEVIESRGGIVGGVTKKLSYLVVGGLGSPEWKHGSFGRKIEKAMQYKREGLPILIVHEDIWTSSL